MSYLAVLSFDVESARPDTYRSIESDLNDIGLSDTITGSSGKAFKLPTTTFVGEFNGENAGKIRDDLSDQIKAVFSKHNVRSKIFLSVGGNWSWGSRST